MLREASLEIFKTDEAEKSHHYAGLSDITEVQRMEIETKRDELQLVFAYNADNYVRYVDGKLADINADTDSITVGPYGITLEEILERGDEIKLDSSSKFVLTFNAELHSRHVSCLLSKGISHFFRLYVHSIL